ncbi:MAG TPA: type II toxin-antitoxin system antitoxin SocA domain-containing protein [Nitrospirales bacterium]|jgi:uncharacterized phage-associated protein
MAPYPAKAIAHYFLCLAKTKGETLTPMKLQKLIYFAHGWYLAIKRQPLINEEIKAWTYGPVIRSIYDEYKSYGGNGIPADCDAVSDDLKEDAYAVSLLNKVWDVYGKFTAFELSNMTHAPETPWYKAWSGNESKIDNEAMREYFMAKASQPTAA